MNLNKLEELLMEYDPSFAPEDVFEERFASKNTIMYRLARDPLSTDPESAIQSQIRLNIERIRIPEILFNPNIAGMYQAGISEAISNILCRFAGHDQQLMAEV